MERDAERVSSSTQVARFTTECGKIARSWVVELRRSYVRIAEIKNQLEEKILIKS